MNTAPILQWKVEDDIMKGLAWIEEMKMENDQVKELAMEKRGGKEMTVEYRARL